MYDFNLNNDEEIRLIYDNVKINIGVDWIEYTCIVTNKRLLFLDYPNAINNSMEDLRISGKINYIRKKEIVTEVYLSDIEKVVNENDDYKIILKNKQYIIMDSYVVIELLKKYL